jgi:3-polyprenyl-4-hydroxybenzoate decarboxylase
MMEEAGMHSIPVISIQQQYGGHARQAALIAAGSGASGQSSKLIIVVDDDIDPSNTSEVIWALATRTDLETSIDIIRGCWTTKSNPILSPEHRRLNVQQMSRALILACKPYSWIDKFPPSIKSSPELLKKIKEKWVHILSMA